jgi:hypothetical protein
VTQLTHKEPADLGEADRGTEDQAPGNVGLG